LAGGDGWLRTLIIFSTPKTYGAVGDNSTDDTEALQDWFDAASESNVLTGNILRVTPGKIYRFTQPIVLKPSTANAVNRVLIDCYGAAFHYAAASPRVGVEVAITIGQSGPGTYQYRYHHSVLQGLYLYTDDPTDKVTLLKFENFDFGSVRDCVVGHDGVEADTTCIEVMGDPGSGNSLVFHNINTSGGEVGARISSSDFTWEGGRIQQHNIGLHLDGCSHQRVRADFSLCKDRAILVEDATAVDLSPYTEGCGDGTSEDDGALIEVNGSKKVFISGYLRCANGPGLNNNVRDAVLVNDSVGVVVQAGADVPQRAFVRVQGDSSHCVVQRGSYVDNAGEGAILLPGPVLNETDDPKAVYVDGARDHLTEGVDVTGTNYVPASIDNWTKEYNAETASESELMLTDDSGSKIVTTSSTLPASGDAYFRFRCKMADNGSDGFTEEDPSERVKDMGLIRLLVYYYRPNTPSPGTTFKTYELKCRVHQAWEEFELKVPDLNGGTFSHVMIENRGDGIELDVDYAVVVCQ
jgi:hypothetical protein